MRTYYIGSISYSKILFLIVSGMNFRFIGEFFHIL